ncbi:hypothetical protein LWI29_022283 [Acer saccharum]|uniref:PIFI-like Ig-like domain-containing protein n=1 Tax=Acer saccharum TaxID=4024 RepID=A0AA39SV54_ACESA|nr:hypothetical protein LWI29_022283 [Acer saccharum]
MNCQNNGSSAYIQCGPFPPKYTLLFFFTTTSDNNILPPLFTSGIGSGSVASTDTALTIANNFLLWVNLYVFTTIFPSTRSVACTSASPSVSSSLASSFTGTSLQRSFPKKKKVVKISGKVTAAATVVTSSTEEIQEFVRPSWAMFELGRAPVYWKTMNGLPPMSVKKLKVFYNPTANKLVPNEEFGFGFNGGFNQPFMCGGEPRAMLKKIVARMMRRFIQSRYAYLSMGLAEELSKEGACDRVIFPDTDIVVDRCAMIGNLIVEGGDRCDLNLVPGCMDPNALEYNPLANVDDGSCLIDLDSEV